MAIFNEKLMYLPKTIQSSVFPTLILVLGLFEDLSSFILTINWEISLLKTFHQWPTVTKIRHTKNFQRQIITQRIMYCDVVTK